MEGCVATSATSGLQRTKMTAREDVIISFDEAMKILVDELKYPQDRALHFVRRFDTNKDGKLSMAEFSAFRKSIEETKNTLVPKFREYDRDGNGYVTLAEASSILEKAPFNFPPEKVIFLLKKFDSDKNNKLDIEEFSDFYAALKATNAEMASKFEELDTDGNGVLSPDEVMVAIKETYGYDDETANWLLKMFDKNDDGMLDKTEFIQLWHNMFK